MWIRSQDKANLMVPKDIWTECTSLWAVSNDYDFRTRIGEFSSSEAALAELDHIERWIDDGAKGVYQVGEG